MSEKQDKKIEDWKKVLFHERLKKMREEAGYTQKEFAEKIGVHFTTLQRYETGDSIPRFKPTLAIVTVLDVSCDYMCGLSDDPKAHKKIGGEA